MKFFLPRILITFLSLLSATSLFAATVNEAKTAKRAEIASTAKKAKVAKASDKAKTAQIAKQSLTARESKMAKHSNKTKKLPNISISQVANLAIAKQHKFVPTLILDAGSLYLVKGYFNTPRGPQPTSLFLSQDLKSAVYGRGFKTSNAKEYKTFTPQAHKTDAIFSFGKGKDEYFLFTDPLCPYCKEFEKNLKKYEDVATFYVFMIALPMHKKAPLAIDYVLSMKDDLSRYTALMDIANNKTDYLSFKTSPDIQKLYDQAKTKQELIAKEFRVQGTPTVYDSNGNIFRRENLDKKYAKKLISTSLQKEEKANYEK